MILVASSMSLLAIVAGMFLLAKTRKDNLSNSFKYISFFIVFVGFLNLLCAGAMFAAKTMMRCHHMEGGHGGYHHGGKGYHHGDKGYHHKKHGGYHNGNCGDGDNCGDGKSGCYREGSEERCCEKGMYKEGDRYNENCKMDCDDEDYKGMSKKSMMMKKDSVVIKK